MLLNYIKQLTQRKNTSRRLLGSVTYLFSFLRFWSRSESSFDIRCKSRRNTKSRVVYSDPSALSYPWLVVFLTRNNFSPQEFLFKSLFALPEFHCGNNVNTGKWVTPKAWSTKSWVTLRRAAVRLDYTRALEGKNLLTRFFWLCRSYRLIFALRYTMILNKEWFAILRHWQG
jgi:hypothetical protein